MKQIMKRFCCFLLAAVMVGSFAISSNATSIKDAKKEKESLQEDLEKAKETIDALEGEKKDIETYVKGLDTQLNELSASIDSLKSELKTKENNLEQKRIELEQARVAEEEQYQAMKKRIKYMYEKGDTAYIELLFSAENIADIMNRADYIAQISEYDRNMLLRYQDTKESIAQQEKDLEKECKEIEAMKGELVGQQSSVENLITEKSGEIEKYEASIEDNEQLAKEYEEEIAEQDAIIKELEAAAALAKKKAEEAAKAKGQAATTVKYDGGTFAWPCPSSSRVTSEYGNRIHPTLGVLKFHNGIDIGAPTGSAIVAAYGGTVISSAYNDTMGNYIMIDHGNGLYTIYMHASSLLVSSGQSVSKGQTIALVGSTGRSTGPHLHFGVRLNGSYVSPWNYLSQ